MMIDIIIPAYNAHSTIMKTLYSIAYQDFINFCSVTIVNDGSEVDYSKEVKFFSNFMKIKEIKLEKNCGPAVARQIGLDNTSNPYIIFIDADDMFLDCFSIKYLLGSIIRNNCEVVSSSFCEEYKGELKPLPNSLIWLHGKIFKRSFLVDKNIKFNDSRSNEDNGFLKLIKLCGANIKFVTGNTYIYINNKNSITRNKDNNYKYSSLEWLAYNTMWAINEGLKRVEYNTDFSEIAYSTLVCLFYNYLKFDYDDNIINISKDLYKFYSNNKVDNEDELYNIQDVYYDNELSKLVKKSNIDINEYFSRIEGVL